MHGLVWLPCGVDGTDHPFRLTLDGLIAIEAAVGETIATIAARARMNMATLSELESIFFHGLVGCGMGFQQARNVIAHAFDVTSRSNIAEFAQTITVAGLAPVYSPSLSNDSQPSGDNERLDAGIIYGRCALMGVDFRDLTLGEFVVIAKAWARANGENTATPPSDDEFEAAIAAISAL